MAFVQQTFVAFEQPTTAKWNILNSNDDSLRDGTGVLWNNNQPISVKNNAAATKQFALVNASDELHIGENNELDHTVINAGTSKLVKLKNLRQDNTSDSYKNNIILLHGWGYIVGDGSPSQLEVVTFGITFSAVPIIHPSWCGNKTSAGAPTAIEELTAGIGTDSNTNIFGCQDSSTTGFTIATRTPNGASNTLNDYYGYSWIAIGQLN